MCIHNTLYHSTIFKTITDELGNTKLSINKGFKGLFSGEFFKKKSILSDDDISALQAYNAEINRGVTSQTAFYRTMQNASVEAQNMAESANGMVVNLEQIPKVSEAGQVALKGLAIAGNMLLMWGISEAITFVAKGIDNLANSAEHCKERVDKLVGDFESGNNTIQQHSETISKIASRYSELSHGVNELGGNVSLTNEEYAEYQDICNQIADMYPTLVKSYDEQGNAILKLKGNVEGLTQALLDEKKANAAKIIESDEIMENYQNTREHGVFDSIGDYFSNFFDSQDELTADMISEQEKVQKYKDFLQMSYEDIKSLTTKIGNDRETIIQRGLLSKLGIDSDTTKEEFDTFRTDLKAEIVTIQAGIDQALSSVKKKAGAYLLYNEDYSSLSENEISVISSLLNNIDEDTANSFGNDDKKIAVYVNKIVKLIHNAKPEVQKAINDWFILGEDVDISTRVSALDTIIQTYKNNGIVIPVYFENQKKELDTLQKNYDDAITKAKKQESDFDWDSWFKENSINTQEEIDRWNKIAESATNAADARKKYTEGEEDNKTDNLSGKSFKQIWNSLGTGDDETSKKVAEEKENLLKLAEAGQLTEEAFKDSSIADTFTKAGYSISGATKEVNGFVEEVKQLNSMKTGISAITSAYDEKKDANDKRVGADTLDSMYGTLGIETWNKQDLKVWEQYKKVASDSKSTLKELKVAQDELATSFVNSNNFLSNITDNTYDYYVSLLTEMGVTNAVSIATNSLNRNKINAATSSFVLTSATEKEIDELGIYVQSLDDSSKQLAWYTIQQQIANNNALDTTESVTNLKRLAEQCGITGKAIKWLGYLQGSQIRLEELKEKKEFNGSAWDNTLDDIEHYQKLITDTVNTKVKVNTPKITTTKGNKSSETKNKDSEKKTKQFYDWIEVKLDRINRKIERFKNTMEVLLKLQSKFSSGRSALSQLSNQYAAQDKAYNRYIKQANKYVNKNGKLKGTNIKASDVRNGKIDITKLNDKQQTAVDNYKQWYDKAIDVNDAKADTILAMRDLAEQMYNLPIEEASEAVEKFSNAISNAEKEIEFAQNAEDKKGYRQKIVQSTYDTYEEQKRAYDWLKKKLASLRPKDGKLKGTNIEVDGETKITNLKKKTDKKGETYYTYNGKKLSGKELRKIEEYNAAVDARAKAEQTKTEAELELVSIIRETAVSLIQDVIDDIELIEDIASATSDVWSSYRGMLESMGNIINSTDYNGEIASVQNESALAYKKWQEAKSKKDYWNSLDNDGKLKLLGLSDSDIANMDNNSKAKALTDGLKELEADVLGFESEYYQKESQKHELIKQKNEQELRNLESQSELIESISSKYEALLSLRDAQGQEFRTQEEAWQQLKNSENELENLQQQRAMALKLYQDASAEGRDADALQYSKNLNELDTSILNKKAEQEEIVNSLYDEQIYKVNQYKEALQKANEEQDKRLQLEKAQYNLLKAMNQKTQKIFNGQEFVYQADEDAIKSAQEELDNLEFERLIDSLDNVAELFEKFAKNNNIYDRNGNRIKSNEQALSDAKSNTALTTRKVEDVLIEKGYEPIELLSDDIGKLVNSTMYNLDNIVSKMPDYSKLNELVSKPTEQKLTISIGDINLSNVNNAEDLARDIVNRLPNTVSQYIRK